MPKTLAAILEGGMGPSPSPFILPRPVACALRLVSHLVLKRNSALRIIIHSFKLKKKIKFQVGRFVFES